MQNQIDQVLDGYILNLFRSDTPTLTEQDFDKPDIWICDLLDQSEDLTNKYLKDKLSKIEKRIDKLQFLYTCRSCFQSAIKEMRPPVRRCCVMPPTGVKLAPGAKPPTKEEVKAQFEERYNTSLRHFEERKARFERALAKTEQAICYFEDCEKLKCEESKNGLCELSNNQIVLLFHFTFKYFNIEPRVNTDISVVAKLIHMLTGKEFKGLNRSDIYQRMRNGPNSGTEKHLIKDLETIKPYFEKVDLKGVIKIIDNEIDMARRELKSK